MNGVLKMKWLQSFLKNGEEVWFSLPSLIFNRLGGIEFLLKCDFDISKLPVKLSAFHQQVLLYWKMIYKHNFSPHNVPLWNNRVILTKRKSLFMDDWISKEIWSIVHLMDDKGTILELDEFNNKYNLNCSIKNYIKVTKSIPTALIHFISNNLDNTPTPKLQSLYIDNEHFLHKGCNNRFLRQYFVKQYTLRYQGGH